MNRKDETNAKRQAAFRARRNEAAKKWEQFESSVLESKQSTVLVLPTNDQSAAIAAFNSWLADTYSLTGEQS